MKSLFKKLEDTLNSGNDVVLCTIIKSTGSTPRESGAKMLVFKDGTIFGTIGGGAIEYSAIQHAIELHDKKIGGVQTYNLSSNDAAGLGMVCGGSVTVCFQYISAQNQNDVKLIYEINKLFNEQKKAWLLIDLNKTNSPQMSVLDSIENIIPPNERSTKKGTIVNDQHYVEPLIKGGYVYIFGGGHISQELVPLISHIEFSPIIFEDREDFAQKRLFPDAVKIICSDFCDFEDKIKIIPEDYIVIMTRGHKNDYDILKFALNTPATYIGLIGSRSKMALTRQTLKADGFSEKDFARIHNPIGLNIKAETPAEIAISVAAELILHRASKKSSL